MTGANGFVGRALCAELLRHAQSVRAALRTAKAPLDDIEVTAVGAIDGETDWTGALRGVDVVIHLAARLHAMKELAADPLSEFLKVNLLGTERLAQQTARAGIKRLVYVSSIKVNGESTLSPGIRCASVGSEQRLFTESDKPNPHGPYAISKWQAEQALQRIAQETGLEVVVVRPPLVYGPEVKGTFLSLLAAMEKGIPLPLAGAENARSLVYVGNLVDALIACAAHPAAAGQTYVVSDGEAVSTAALFEKIAHALNRPNRCFYLPTGLLRAVASLLGRSDQVEKLFGSLLVSDKKIRSELGWTPPYSLEQGLRATADWYIARRAAVGYNRGTL